MHTAVAFKVLGIGLGLRLGLGLGLGPGIGRFSCWKGLAPCFEPPLPSCRMWLGSFPMKGGSRVNTKGQIKKNVEFEVVHCPTESVQNFDGKIRRIPSSLVEGYHNPTDVHAHHHHSPPQSSGCWLWVGELRTLSKGGNMEINTWGQNIEA